MSIQSRITRGIGFGALAVAELGLVADVGGTKFVLRLASAIVRQVVLKSPI